LGTRTHSLVFREVKLWQRMHMSVILHVLDYFEWRSALQLTLQLMMLFAVLRGVWA
jgi:hypothetical protein